jgi:2-polyprenyl-6-methoxyphenol hydroxylase-like FAD-dependent oxidoreductase
MQQKAQVLVVGAGPVGLLAALVLRERGIDVTVIERKEPEHARNFAVVLHPRAVALLDTLGITEPLIWQGQSFRQIAVYSEGEQRALLNVQAASPLADGALTLPQNVLRSSIENALRQRGVIVRYHHRLLSLESNAHAVLARVMRRQLLGSSEAARGAAWEDVEGIEFEADFVIGADGHDSAVRDALGIRLDRTTPPESYVFFDVPRARESVSQTEIVLSEDAASAVYPLHGGMKRFSFEVASTDSRLPNREDLSRLVEARMPWRDRHFDSVEWSGSARFQRAVAERFGVGRVWLAGDAAHKSSPLGVQSLNVGLYEARELADALSACLEGRSPVTNLSEAYGSARLREWRRLLGLGAPLELEPNTPTWILRHRKRLISSLPASRDDLDDLLDQLRIQLP